MDLAWGVSIYFVIWWIVLFAILPLGVRSHAQEGKPVPGGGDPASPVDPKIARKALTTTWVSAIVWVVIWAVFHFGLIRPPPPGG
jgi:predicted secreted protein